MRTSSRAVMIADATIELVESAVARPAHIVRLCPRTTRRHGRAVAVRGERATRSAGILICFADRAQQWDCGLRLRRSVVQWTRLNLEGNNLGKDGANPIFWALRVNCTLTELLMSDNKIGGDFGTDRDKMGEHGTARGHRAHHTLRMMDRRGTICRGGATCVAHALLENLPGRVQLERNSFDAGAADQLATRLATDGQIKFLNLRCNHCELDGCGALRCSIGEHRITAPRPGYNGAGSCGPVAGRALPAIEKNETHLDLEGTNWLGVGRRPHGHHAEQHARCLNVRNNRFDVRTGEKCSRADREFGADGDLLLGHVEIGDDNFQKVARVMKERASVAGMEDPDVLSGGNTDVFALAEVDSTFSVDSDRPPIEPHQFCAPHNGSARAPPRRTPGPATAAAAPRPRAGSVPRTAHAVAVVPAAREPHDEVARAAP